MVSGRLYVKVRTLLENWTIDNLLGKHESRPYNPNVATVMYIMPDLSRAGAVSLNKFVQHVLQMGVWRIILVSQNNHDISTINTIIVTEWSLVKSARGLFSVNAY